MFTSILINQEHNKIIHGAAAINALNLLDYRKRQTTQKCVRSSNFLFIYDLGGQRVSNTHV